MKKSLNSLLLVTFLFLTIDASGQSTQLIYKTKGKTSYRVNIVLSNDMGREDLSPEEFRKRGSLYFLITAAASSKKDYFKDGDISEYFSKIVIHQDGSRIEQNGAPSSFSNKKGKLNRIIISFAKDKIKLYEPFSFVNEIGESPKIKIRETFLSSYDRYHKMFERAKSLIDSQEYIEAFKTLSQIGNDSKTHLEISSFSFYQNAMQDLSAQAVRGYVDSLSSAFSRRQKQFTVRKTKPSLDACDSVFKAFKEQASLFQTYLHS